MERLTTTPTEAAKALGTRTAVIFEGIHAGEIPAYRDGRNWKIPIKSLEEYVINRAETEAKQRRQEHEEHD